MISTISTYAGLLQRQNTTSQLQGQISQLSTEESTGLLADPVLQLGSSVSTLYGLQAASAQQTAVQTAATAVGQRMDAMSTALGSIGTVVSQMATTALTISTGAGDQQPDVVNAQTEADANQVLGFLNASYAGQYVFSGNDSGNPAVSSSYSSLLGAAQTALQTAATANGGTVTTSDLASFESSLDSTISTTPGSLFTAQNDGRPVQVSIGGSQSLSYGMKANSQPFQTLMKGFAMLSLATDSTTPLDAGARAQMLTDANSAIQSAQSQITTATGEFGAQQTSLQNVADAQQTAATATQTQLAALDAADPYKTASELSALQTQLQATYEITSLISKLSFVNYMN